MINYVIAHVPHASTDVPHREHYCGDVDAEQAIVTDWATDRMVKADETVMFPFSRLWCDVERLTDDPLHERGLGIFVTRRLNGELLREANEPYLGEVQDDYAEHHQKVVTAIAGAISLMPVCLLDVHSYSDEQARLMGHNEPYPDICLGYDEGSVAPALITAIASLFDNAGYSVGLNQPYRGALVPAAFAGNPDFFAVMVEVNKSVYLRESAAVDTERFATLTQVMDVVVQTIRGWPTGA